MANLIRQVARVIETKWGRFHICAKGLYFWDEMTTCYLFKKKYWDQWHHASWSSIWWQGAFLGWKLKLIIKATCVEHTTIYFRMIRVSKRNAWKLKKLKKSYFEKKSANFWHIKNYSRISESTNVCCIELNTFPSYHVTPYLVKSRQAFVDKWQWQWFNDTHQDLPLRF